MREMDRVVRDNSPRQRPRSSKVAGIVIISSIIGGGMLAWGMWRQRSGLPGAGHDAGTTVTLNTAPSPGADADVGVAVANDAAPPAMQVPAAASAVANDAAPPAMQVPATASAAREPSATQSKPARRFVRRAREFIPCTTSSDQFATPRGLPPCPPATSEDRSTSAAGVVHDTSAAGVVHDTLFEDRR